MCVMMLHEKGLCACWQMTKKERDDSRKEVCFFTARQHSLLCRALY